MFDLRWVLAYSEYLFRGEDPASASSIPTAEVFPALDAFWVDLVGEGATSAPSS